MQIVSTTDRRRQMPMGDRIRARRKALGLTLQQVAERSGLSAPFISQAERDLSVPSLVSLLALADALTVDLTYFMEVPDSGTIVHRAAKPRRIEVDSPVDYIDLASNLADRKLDIILMRVPPGHAFPTDQRNGEDFLYVVEGEVTGTVGKTKAKLGAGDSLHFDSLQPHSARNASDRDVVLLYVGTPSIFRKSADGVIEAGEADA
ncbi:helix-turn-helix domain-containing protein [Nitrospirillum viridazoti]|uniref:XRE family transcriptional regulator n=1 Tax=Nitrospirillum amazonense TaxID=28077 RepID=A0A560HWN6_9PROT|nr:XRE family transcriptional regulator [Nitrospirillum amazonense]TWB51067.1 XRE family transcriptional regulator [Nitrospirillum amazonense]